jgi:FkbM family methyltransferase
VSFSKWLRPEAGGWLSRWSYYLSSIPTLLFKIRRPQTVIGAFLGLSARRPFQIRLADGTRFFVRNALDIWLVKENCLDGDYERGEVPIRNGWTVVDIGAGLGEFAVWVARRHPKSIVYAFEPLPESFALLVENVRLNGLSNVRPIQKAVFAAEGMVRLHAPSGLAGQHRRAAAGSKPASGAIEADATTLDRALEDLPIDTCDFLKIDCEGAEYEILFSAPAATLERVRHIAMEYHEGVTEHSHDELARFLESKGFRVRTRPNPAHREIGFLFASRREPGGA